MMRFSMSINGPFNSFRRAKIHVDDRVRNTIVYRRLIVFKSPFWSYNIILL